MYKYQYYKTLPTKISLYDCFNQKLKTIWVYDNISKQVYETTIHIKLNYRNIYDISINFKNNHGYPISLTYRQMQYSYCWIQRDIYFSTSCDEVYLKYLEYKDKKYSI